MAVRVMALGAFALIGACSGPPPVTEEPTPKTEEPLPPLDVVVNGSIQVGVYEAGATVTVWDRLFSGELAFDTSGCPTISIDGIPHQPIFEEGVRLAADQTVTLVSGAELAPGSELQFGGMPQAELAKGGEYFEVPRYVAPNDCDVELPIFFVASL